MLQMTDAIISISQWTKIIVSGKKKQIMNVITVIIQWTKMIMLEKKDADDDYDYTQMIVPGKKEDTGDECYYISPALKFWVYHPNQETLAHFNA